MRSYGTPITAGDGQARGRVVVLRGEDGSDSADEGPTVETTPATPPAFTDRPGAGRDYLRWTSRPEGSVPPSDEGTQTSIA
jgi:hypothetical protein